MAIFDFDFQVLIKGFRISSKEAKWGQNIKLELSFETFQIAQVVTK